LKKIETIKECIAEGCSLLDVCLRMAPNQDELEVVSEHKRQSSAIPKTSDGIPLQDVLVFMNRVVYGPQFQSGVNMLFHSIKNLCDDKTEYVIELGAGTGKNLAFAYSELKKRYR